MKKSRKFLLPFSLVLLLVVAGMFYMKSIVSHADTIPSDSIKNQLETMYNGEVNNLLLHDNIYGATLTREGSVYAVRVDGATGKVLSMILKEPSTELVSKQKEAAEVAKKDESSVGKPEEVPTQSAPEKPKPQPKPKPQEKPQPKPPVNKPAPQKTVLLTEQQAIQIALRQLNGEVDDVDFVKTLEGGYYLVEIEIDVDDGPDEATYQIHAISGKVMSVTWDD